MRTNPDATTLACEALVNCWIREGGRVRATSEHELQIPLKKSALRIRFEDRTALGDLRLATPPVLEGHEVTVLELADALVEEMSREKDTTSRLPTDWRENVAGSADNLAKILAANPLPSTRLDFIASEQALLLGHRFHPSPKSRIGFSSAELETYSPEWHGRFRMHYLCVADELIVVRGDPSFAESWRDRMRTFSDDGWILPLHPWQARRALTDPGLQAALRSGAIANVGELGPEFYATSSVRTLYQPEWDLFVKTSLRVRITNCFRENLPRELETLASLRALVRDLLPADGNFRALDEPLSLDLNLESAVRCGAIFREGLGAEKSRNAEPLLAAAFFGDRHFSLERLATLIGREVDRERWFRRYSDALVPPVLRAFFDGGIMLEPHLQNILFSVEPDGGVSFLQRDLDNVKIVEGSRAERALAHAPEGVRAECLYPRPQAWKRLIYCLIVNHLSEVIATVARLRTPTARETLAIEKRLWTILRDVILENFRDEPLARELVESPTLWAKQNFLTRVTRTADREAPFAAIPNPINQANR